MAPKVQRLENILVNLIYLRLLLQALYLPNLCFKVTMLMHALNLFTAQQS